MSLSPIGNSPTSLLQLVQDKRSAMKSMLSAIQSGDMKTAQADATQIQNDTTQIGSITGSNTSSGSTNPYKSTLKTDLTNLLQAVQSGSQSQATSALNQLQSDQAAIHAHAATQDADGDANQGPVSTSGAPSSSNPFVTDLKTLLTSISSGDSAGAKTAATALQNDLNNATGGASQTNAQPTSSTTGSGNFLSDLQSLIGAAQSGNLSGAQSAAGNLANDITSALGGHGGHHHHHDSDQASSAQAAGGSTSANNLQSVLALLKSIAQSAGSAGSSNTGSTTTTQTPAPQTVDA